MAFRECSIPDCNADAAPHNGGARGWCKAHYARWRRHGDPERGGPIARQAGTGQPCSIGECSNPVIALDLCENHYRRFKRYGDARAGRIKPLSVTSAERFWSKVDKTDACWNWTDAPNGSGYGTFKETGGRPVLAHRYSMELAGHALTSGLTIDHLCRNRLCVNPAHLEEVSYGENLRRAASFAAQGDT